MNDVQSIYIQNANIYVDNSKWQHGSLKIENGKIAEIHTTVDSNKAMDHSAQTIDGTGLNVIPGFIDGHIHGAAGADVMDGTEEALDAMASALPQEGTTSFLATTITQSPENTDAALENISNYQNKSGQAEVIGAHLEGPFIETAKKGAQPEQYIVKPDIDVFNRWQRISGNNIKTITMAPEHDEDGTFIHTLKEQGVNVSAGHTGIDYKGMQEAVGHGVRQMTHLCNAMEGIHHREIGAVGAAFRLEELRAELIADGIHVVPEMMQLIYDNMGSERLILITDAMRAKCLDPGDYELGGQPVKVTSDRATLENGSLAGSILKLRDGAENMLNLSGVSLEDVVEMTAANPAKQIQMYDQKGRIKIGQDADVLVVDNELNIHYTICNGVIAHKEV